ncbi:hypothetical protein HPB50_003159 [Hyalomma asiaticum]|uniref:Uncharacterized protein n=1 Tax=Hyalomma asiaticum TaxID=266040 RepID=A0ACB7RQP4_HYAAI|nr:hypothetical protein HPB50_003159 [Hyalomma asiaticum]
MRGPNVGGMLLVGVPSLQLSTRLSGRDRRRTRAARIARCSSVLCLLLALLDGSLQRLWKPKTTPVGTVRENWEDGWVRHVSPPEVADDTKGSGAAVDSGVGSHATPPKANRVRCCKPPSYGRWSTPGVHNVDRVKQKVIKIKKWQLDIDKKVEGKFMCDLAEIQ